MGADHDKYGVEDVCPECWRKTIVAMSFTSNPTVPSEVQAVCRSVVECGWHGPRHAPGAAPAQQQPRPRAEPPQPPLLPVVAKPEKKSKAATKAAARAARDIDQIKLF